MLRRILALALVIVLAQAAAAAVLDGRLAYLRALRQEIAAGRIAPPASVASGDRDAQALAIAGQDVLPGSIRFAAPPTATDLAAVRDLGVTFYDFGHGLAGSRTVVPARIPFASLDALSALPAVVAIDGAWRVAPRPPLYRSRPQVEAEQAWQVLDPDGLPLTGAGVVLSDFDTGVFYYHPMFFFADGPRYDWIDADGSGTVTTGDGVDLDGNGSVGAGESLRYVEALGTTQYGNSTGQYDAAFDFLYADTNGSGSRDSGPPTYGENDPCYGEPWFIVDDTDGDGVLDIGEQLIALGTSKVRAIYGRDGVVHTRGVDLLQSEGDYYGHGGPVAGIFGGGWAWRHAMTGIAPDVEQLPVMIDYAAEPSFLLPIEAGLAWARDEGADIVLIEDGEWAWEYMDGSSNTEIMLNELAANDGIIIVVPAGNLAASTMHTIVGGNAGTSLTFASAGVAWVDFLWTDGSAVPMTITPPGGATVAIPTDGSFIDVGDFHIYGNLSSSTRGTRRQDIRLNRTSGSSIVGAWQFGMSGGAATTVHGYFWDDASGWYSSSSWQAPVQTHTVTWPATADSAISVAAYDPAGDGDINDFSGGGPRLDGRPDVALAAPGSVTYSTHSFVAGAFTSFGGTSAAGPHVAGAVALLKQLDPDLGSGRCRALLQGGAGTDAYTADPDRWGAGKLRIRQAIAIVLTAIADGPPSPTLPLTAYPNPFNPTTTLRFSLPQAGPAELRIFSLDGRQVWSRAVRADAPGPQQVTWQGQDGHGRALPSGVYVAYVKQGAHVAATRVTLVK